MHTDATDASETDALDPAIYISCFASVKDNGQAGFYNALNNIISWSDFLLLLDYYRLQRLTHKEAAPLFAPTVFQGARSLNHATASGMACIDTDHCDLSYDDIVRLFEQHQVEAVVYTTAHNTQGDRYRVIVPFAESVDPVTRDKAVRAICRVMSPKWSHDAGKSACYSRRRHSGPQVIASYILADLPLPHQAPRLIQPTASEISATRPDQFQFSSCSSRPTTRPHLGLALPDTPKRAILI
jgi:hypothetical protein